MAHKLADNSLAGTHTRHKIHSSHTNTPCKTPHSLKYTLEVCHKKGGFWRVCGKRHFVSGVGVGGFGGPLSLDERLDERLDKT